MIKNLLQDMEKTYKEHQNCMPGKVCYQGYDIPLGLASVGLGWGSLVKEAFASIEDSDPPVKIFQIKEKWGGLRIYTNIINDKVDKKLLDIMKRSYYICEVCGDDGVLRQGERMQVLCDTHGGDREKIEDAL